MKPVCTLPGCERPNNARGLCGLHYAKAQHAGLFGTPCAKPDCGKPAVGGGLCSTHYRRANAAKNRLAHNAKQRAYMKVYRVTKMTQEMRDAMLASGERYRSKNLNLFADKERIRRGKKRANGGTYTKRDWQRLVNRFGGKCAYCMVANGSTADHVIPVARGGTNYIGNILPACFSCNSSKQDKLLIEWRPRRV